MSVDEVARSVHHLGFVELAFDGRIIRSTWPLSGMRSVGVSVRLFPEGGLAHLGHGVLRAGRRPIDRLGGPVSRPERERKLKRTRLRKGAPWLKTMLVQYAWAAKQGERQLLPGPVLPP
jgi:hypothetical protein